MTLMLWAVVKLEGMSHALVASMQDVFEYSVFVFCILYACTVWFVCDMCCVFLCVFCVVICAVFLGDMCCVCICAVCLCAALCSAKTTNPSPT